MTDATLPSPQSIPRRWGCLLAWLAVLGLLGLVGWKLWQGGLAQVSSGPAPDFTLNTFDGPALRLSTLKGQAVVINFWASWCIPCRDEAPLLERTWRTYKDSGVVFIGVAYLDDEKSARAFLAEFNITYPNGPDLGTQIAPLYRIKGIPETFFINRVGELNGVYVGPISEVELRQRIEALLPDAQ